MRKIETLSVKVTYEVEIGSFEVPEDVFKALQEMEGRSIHDSMAITEDAESDAGKTWAFLTENIGEKDLHSIEYEIEQIIEE